MSVDMFEYRFREELNKLPPFIPNDVRDPRVWPRKGSSEAEFPAWHALFSSLCLYGHSTGYRLFSYDDFFRYCSKAYCKSHPQAKRFTKYFEGDLLVGMRQRVSAWYESGMAEAYLYACLAEAFEDKAKSGLVIYDPRVDWKLKADLIVIANEQPVLVSAFVGAQSDRSHVESNRDAIERDRKKNTMESSHWDNVELVKMPFFEISRTTEEMQTVGGVRLFSLVAINRLISQICQKTGAKEWLFGV